MTRMIVAAVMGLWTLVAVGASDPRMSISQLYASSSTWKRMDWNDAEQSQVWTANGWLAHTGEQDYDKRVEVSDASVEMAGIRFTATIGHGSGADSQQHFSVMHTDASDCREVLPKLSDLYGVARTSNMEFAIKVTPDYASTFTANRAQWDIGTTRVTANCVKGPSPDAAHAASIQLFFEPIASAKLLTPMFALRCSSIKVQMFGKERDAEDMTWWVDQFSGSIMLQNHQSFANNVGLSDTELKFSRNVGRSAGGHESHSEFQYTIDRITGNLNISGVSDGQTVRMIGKCEKSDEMKQAF